MNTPRKIAYSLAFASVCVLFLAFILLKNEQPEHFSHEKWLEREAVMIAEAMTVPEKASQVLMVCIDGKTSFTRDMRDHFRLTVPGAVLLFRHNIAGTPEQVRAFIDSCNAGFDELGGRASVLFSVDHEGGDVVRTRGVTSPLPSARFVADHASAENAERLYELSGIQLAELGIDMNLAPVVEPLDVMNESFLKTRSYSADVTRVVEFSSAAIRGYRAAGIMTTLKHFPGNGDGDPHVGLPRLEISRKELLGSRTSAFRDLLSEHPEAILVSHIIVTSVDDKPFCLSYEGVTGILRKKMGYAGVIMTDDIAMAALSANGYNAPDAAVAALEAGCDLVMVSSPAIGSIVSAIVARSENDSAFASRLDEAVLRILKMKAGYGLVKTARERYSESRYSESPYGQNNPRGKKTSFDADRFFQAKTEAQRLLEDMNGQ